MMRLSTKGRYGARIMLDLALNSGKGPVLLKDIAKRQEISEGYLEHLLPPLKTAGLLNASRGAHGGYALSKEPSQITLEEIILAMEGSITPVECVDTPGACSRIGQCAMRDIWGELGKRIHQTLAAVTLEDMLNRQKQKRELVLTYNI